MQNRVRVGVIGCGKISSAYFTGCKPFSVLELAACADMEFSRAQSAAAEYNIPKAYTVAELLADPDIDLVLNLTVPQAHIEISLAAIAAGKHVYCEKPLAVTREDGQRTLDAAREQGVLVGCAPDTVLGGGIQTCRKLIDDGWIGTPVAATAFMMSHGPESWHPNPGFYYLQGGGPMLDMGPYYLTALITLLGAVQRVSGATSISAPERMATSPERYGERLPVEVATHVAGLMNFQNGAIGTIITTFDVWSANLPRIEIYGTAGTLSVPDPNTFGGPVLIRRAGASEWSPLPLTHSDQVSRGIGLADMASAILNKRAPRASGALAFHVLDIMHAFEDSSQSGKHIELTSAVERPAPLPLGLLAGQID